MPTTLNPFLYGRPVPPTRFVGRRDAARTIFSRLYNGESTAVVGEPHIGKSSLLAYVTDERVRREWLGDAADGYLLGQMDCHLMPNQFTPEEFWREALAGVAEAVNDPAVTQQLHVAADNRFGSFTLYNLFQLVAAAGRRLVLVVDEFDTLLYHPNFGAEFFGGLRSLAIRTEGLSILTASRLSVSVMNRRSQELNPHGSPFFNNLTEARLLPLSLDECRTLIDMTLSKTRIRFSEDDYVFLHSLAGRHPFLVQTAAAGIFDAAVEGKTGEERYEMASRLFHDRAAAHFDDFWQHLLPVEQTALVVLALGEMKGRLEGREFDSSDLGEMQWYGPELAHLRDAGMVEECRDEEAGKAPAGLTLWRDSLWRSASRGFVWWVADNIIAGTRETVGFEPWLDDKEHRGLLTGEQARQVRSLAQAIPKEAVVSPGQMGELLTVAQPVNLPTLRQALVDGFSDGELRDLAFDHGIDYENLPGDNKRDRAREIVAFFARRDRVEELEAAVKALRPSAQHGLT